MNDENITNNSEEELSDNIITLTDEEGKESNFELLDLVELDNEEYVVLLPVDDEESEECFLQMKLNICQSQRINFFQK